MPRTVTSPLPWLGGLLVVYLAFPLVAFVDRVLRHANRGFGEPGLWSALAISTVGATISLLLIAAFGIPLAYSLAHSRGPVATVVGVLVAIPLALPPLMSGILLVYVIGPYSSLGQHFGGRLTDSFAGVVIAQSFVSAPFLVIAARAAFATVDPALDDLAATLGHRRLSRFFRIHVRCAAPGIRAGMLLAWLRAFGEYGATVIVAYHPFSLPIYTNNQFQTSPLSTSEAPTILALATAAVAVLLGQSKIRLRRSRPLPAPRPPRVAAPTPVGFDLAVSVGTFRLRVAHPSGASRLAILGPSGAGKSMTLRALAGLMGPGVGPVTYAGVDVAATRTEQRRVGYVPQGLGLIPGLTVRQQVLFGVDADPALAAWWISTLQLKGLDNRYPNELSGGQRQRVSLARAMACEPDLLLLDEPLSALDAAVRVELRRELRRLQQMTGMSTVLVTHDPTEAAFLAEEVIVISDGAVLQAGTVAGVIRQPETVQIARLLGIENVFEAEVRADSTIAVGSLSVSVLQPPGTPVLWTVRPEQIRVIKGEERPTGSVDALAQAEVVDVVDLGVVVEVSVQLLGGPLLRARETAERLLAPHERCRVFIEPGDVAVWSALGDHAV